MARPLFGGYGYHTGVDSAIAQSESFNFRKDLSPKEDLWVFGTETHSLIQGAITTGLWGAADTLYLSALSIPQSGARLAYARIGISTAVAGGTIRAALYTYDREAKNFIKVGGSDVEWPTDATGAIQYKLNAELTLNGEQQYFLGYGSSTVTTLQAVIISAAARTTLGWPNVVVPAIATNKLPGTVTVSGLTTTTASIEIPLVSYLTQDAQTVF